MPDSATVIIRGEESDLKQSLNRSHSAVEGFGSSVKGMLVGLGLFIAAKKIFDFGVGFITAAAEAEQASARLDAALDSTGRIAGHTRAEIEAMARSLQEMTVHDDDAAIGAAALLAQFKNLQGVHLEDTLITAANLSAALGGDLASNAEKLGRALNTPGEGLRTLRQMGVAFTDSQADVIQALAATGHMAEAQKIILDELGERFSGAAASKVETFSGKIQQMKNRMGNVAEEIGAKLIPIVERLFPVLETVATWIESKGVPAIGNLIDWLTEWNSWLWEKLQPSLMRLWEVGTKVFSGLGAVIMPMLTAWAELIYGTVLPAIVTVIEKIVEWGAIIIDYLQPVFHGLFEVALHVFTAIQTVVQNFGAMFELTFVSIGLAAVKTFEVLKYWLTKVLPAYLKWFADNWRAIWNDSLNFLKTIVTNMWTNIVEFWEALKGIFKGKGFDFEWTPLLKGFQATVQKLPEIAEREMGPLEAAMERRVAELSRKVRRSFADNLAANRAGIDALGDRFNGGSFTDAAGAKWGESEAANYAKTKANRDKLVGIGGNAAADSGSFAAAFEGLTDLNKRITSAARSDPAEKIVKKLDDNALVAKHFAERNAKAAEKTADAMPAVIAAVAGAGALKK